MMYCESQNENCRIQIFEILLFIKYFFLKKKGAKAQLHKN
jgi:hypothetical protein